MTKIKSIDPMSLGKIEGGVSMILGLIIGLIMGLIMMVIGITTGIGFLAGMGVLYIIGIPLFYGFIGFIGGIIGGVAYNFVASKFGGLEIELED